MRSILSRLAIAPLLMLLLAAPPALADWTTNFDKGARLYSEKDYRGAEAALIEALGETDAMDKGDKRRIDTLMLLADTYRQLRQWAAAAPLYEQVVEAYKAGGTDQSPEAGHALNRLGIAYHQMRAYDKAEAAYEGSLAIKRRRYRQNMMTIAVVETNLAELYRRRKAYDKAEQMLVKALEVKEGELGPDHPMLVPTLVDLGLAYLDQRKAEQAIPVLVRGVDLARATEDKHERAERLVPALANLGDAYFQTKDYASAQKSYEEAIAIGDAELGKAHPFVSTALNGLGNTLVYSGKPADALPLFERAIKIREDEYGRDSARLRVPLNSYAYALERTGKSAEAAKVRERVKGLK